MTNDPPIHMTYKQWLAGGILIACIAGGFGVWAAFVGRGNSLRPGNVQADSQSVMRRLEFRSIDAIKQFVNKKRIEEASDELRHVDRPMSTFRTVGDSYERATFRFVVANTSDDPTSITGATLLVDEIDALRDLMTTLVSIPLIDHKGHVETYVNQPKIGDGIPVNINAALLPDSAREFVVWFRSTDPVSILYVTGRLRLHTDGGAITSDPFKIEIHPETNEFRSYEEARREAQELDESLIVPAPHGI